MGLGPPTNFQQLVWIWMHWWSNQSRQGKLNSTGIGYYLRLGHWQFFRSKAPPWKCVSVIESVTPSFLYFTLKLSKILCKKMFITGSFTIPTLIFFCKRIFDFLKSRCSWYFSVCLFVCFIDNIFLRFSSRCFMI